MSAMRAENARPPRFTAYEEVAVDIDPEDLAAAGWVYVGKDAKLLDVATTVEAVVAKVEAWHNGDHAGPFRWCSHALCDSIRGREAGL